METKILVIDDEKDFCHIFQEVLTKEGYGVITALSGKEGIKKVKEQRPDIVFLDLKMPKMDGIEALRRIKKIDKDVVVVMITAYGAVDTAKEAMKLDAYDYVSKPFDLGSIKAVVREALSKREYQIVVKRKKVDE